MPKKTNFEKLKDAIYRHIRWTMEDKVKLTLLMDTVKEKRLLPSFHSKERMGEFEKDLTQWVDTLDIRAVPILVDMFKDTKVIPLWIANNKYVIDCNAEGQLDLMKLRPAG